MQVPDEIRSCVVFVGYKDKYDRFSLQGTGFFLTRDIEGTAKGFVYLITAKHLIKGMASLDDFDGQILLRINFSDGNAYTVPSLLTAWLFHPDEDEVDVAILPWSLRSPSQEEVAERLDVRFLPWEICLSDSTKKRFELGLGDDVFLTGLFHNHHGRKRNIPIVRMGSIAAMPDEEKVYLKDLGFAKAYLIECRSIGGLSGSPVFVRFGPIRFFDGEMKVAGGPYGEYKLLGLMHGHWDTGKFLTGDGIDATQDDVQKKEAVNMGIAIVVPVEKILEVIGQPLIRNKEIEREKEIHEQASSIPNLSSP